MSMTYHYVYAEIIPETGECIGVFSSDSEMLDVPQLVRLEVQDDLYTGKYYNRANGMWYEDAGFTIPWTSSLL